MYGLKNWRTNNCSIKEFIKELNLLEENLYFMVSSNKINKGVNVLNKADRDHNLVATRQVLERCVHTMKSPRMMHFIVEFDIALIPSKIIQKIKETYHSQFKKFEKERHPRLKDSHDAKLLKDQNENYRVRKRKPTDIEIIYSIESKIMENNGYKYDHIHFMFIVDFGNHRYGYREMMSIINRTLNKTPFVKPLESENDFSYIGYNGENECGFFRYRDVNSTTQAPDVVKDSNGKFMDKYGHNLKVEFNDAMIRASYLCKSEQKDLLPEHIKRYSFGHTRAPRVSNDEMYQQVV